MFGPACSAKGAGDDAAAAEDSGELGSNRLLLSWILILGKIQIVSKSDDHLKAAKRTMTVCTMLTSSSRSCRFIISS